MEKQPLKRFFKILGSLILGVVHFMTHAQNLVPNPSFEDTVNCPTGISQLYNAKFWVNPTAGSPDYFNPCADYLTGVKPPKTAFGYQYPRSGNSYGGFYLAAETIFGGPLDEREYIQVNLLDSLKSGVEYCVKFYIVLSNFSSVAISQVGVYFSSAPIWRGDYYNFTDTPQVVSTTGFLTDTLNWMEVSGSFIANGGEQFITIGNYNDISGTDTMNVTPSIFTGYYSYYHIDDISVVECGEIQPIPRPIPPISYPNIFTPNNDGVNDKLEFLNLPDSSQLSIFNRWGNLVFESQNYQNDWAAVGSSDGVYFYIIKLPTGETKKGSIQINR